LEKLTAEQKRRVDEELLADLDAYLDGQEAQELQGLAGAPPDAGQPPAPPEHLKQKER